MTPEALIAALEASPSYLAVQGKHRKLLLKSVELLGAGSRTPEQLSHELRNWFSRDVLEDTLPGLLERYGLFRRQATGDWALADGDLLGRSFDTMPVCVVDVEATGGRPPLHRIIEVGAMRIEPDGAVSRLSSLVNPGRPLPPYISHMTGLSQSQLDAAPPMASLMPGLQQFFDGAILVAHDVSGDMELFNYEFFRHSGRFVENPIACTVAVTRALRPQLERSGLEFVAQELGIAFEQKHRALGDAEATASIWRKLAPELSRQGAATLLDLSFYQGQIGTPQFLQSRLSVERVQELPRTPALFRLLNERQRPVLVEATPDLQHTLRDYFFPRRRQHPLLKRAMRETVDFSYEIYATGEEALQAAKAERPPVVHRRPPRRRK